MKHRKLTLAAALFAGLNISTANAAFTHSQ